MCFIVAKDFNKQGCIAMQMRGGKELVDLKEELYSKIDMNRIQLVTISRPSAFGEYEPYVFANSVEEFKRMTVNLW